MLTGVTEPDWALVIEIFDASRSSSGEPGHNDHYGSMENIA
ncbi:hypothetical protein ACMS1Z_18635 [Acidiphilium multivorum]